MKFDKIYNKVLTKILDEVSAMAGGGVTGYAAPLEFKEEEQKEEQEEVNEKNNKNKD